MKPEVCRQNPPVNGPERVLRAQVELICVSYNPGLPCSLVVMFIEDSHE